MSFEQVLSPAGAWNRINKPFYFTECPASTRLLSKEILLLYSLFFVGLGIPSQTLIQGVKELDYNA